MGRAFQTLTIDDVIEINRRMTTRFGGLFIDGDSNLANPGSLEYVLEEIQGSLFGQEFYPSVIEKAAAIGWRIIASHVFHDGNKRTGMEACRLFLELNHYAMRIDWEIIDMAVAIANSKVQLPEFKDWVLQRTVKTE